MVTVRFSRCQQAIARTLIGVMLVLGSFLLIQTTPAETLKGGVLFTDKSYRIGPGDVLSLHVYYQPDFQQDQILVRPDGQATFNVVGELYVTGMTVRELSDILTREIGELVIEPKVTVSVVRTKPGTVYLAGAIKNPGMYQFSTNIGEQTSTSPGSLSRSDLRLSNVLANAGGVMMDADLANIQIKEGDKLIKTVNLWQMLKEGNSTEDVVLHSGDSVVIPRLAKMALSDEDYQLLLSSSLGPRTFPVRMIGELGQPGIYELSGESPYLNSAIAKAGGFKEGANKKMLAIRRFTSENNFSTLYVDPAQIDVILRPNDVVFVAEQKIYRAGRFAQTVSQALAPFTNATQAMVGLKYLSGN